MRPELTGKGFGTEFVSAIINFSLAKLIKGQLRYMRN